MFCITLKDCFLEPQAKCWLCLHLEKDSMSYYSVSVPYFVVWIIWPELQIYSQGVWFFAKLEKNY